MSDNNFDCVYCSLGNYCKTSNLLQTVNLKYESYPFDWMVFTINNIIEIISDNFKQFLNKENYTLVNHINGELGTKNIVYFNDVKKLFSDQIDTHSHHNLIDDKDYQYLNRCVNRFNNLSKYKIIKFIMIQPFYRNNSKCDYNKIKKLYEILIDKFGKERVKLIFFNILDKNNKIFKEEKINENCSIFELNTNIIIGPSGMQYFDENGVKKFIDIVKNF